MPKRKKGNPPLWSVPRIRDPRYPGWTVRVTELKGEGVLYVVYMKEGKQKMASLRRTRHDLGRTAKAQEQTAHALALDIIAALAEGNNGDVEPPETGEALTLGTLTDLYEKHGLHGVGASYRRDQVAKVRRIKEFLGAERLVVSLCRSDIRRFEAHRLKVGVRRSTVHGDLDALKIACNWATEHK